jgi:hypothetical protein
MSGGILTLSVETRQRAEGSRAEGKEEGSRYKGIMTVWADMILKLTSYRNIRLITVP